MPPGVEAAEAGEGTTSSSLTSTLQELVAGEAPKTTAYVHSGERGAEAGVMSGVTGEQKLFLVMSVALATVCFFTNAVQICVFLREGKVRTVKNLLLISQGLSGLVAVAVVAFPIEVISSRGGVAITEEGFDMCYLSHSGVILLTMFTSLSTATLLLLDHHLHKHHHDKYVSSSSSLLGWLMAVGVAWIWAGLVSVLPWLGWNTWQSHDARCHLSTIWPLSFTAFVTFLVAIHIFLALLMYASGRAAKTQAKNSHQRLQGQLAAAEPTPQQQSVKSEGSVRVAGWLISLSSVVPVLGHVLLASSCAASHRCMESARHYHEDAASLPWATLLLSAAAVANPLLYIFSDDSLLARFCCARNRTPQNNRPPRNGSGCATAAFHGGEGGVVTTSTTSEGEVADLTGSFVTCSDTHYLVGGGS